MLSASAVSHPWKSLLKIVITPYSLGRKGCEWRLSVLLTKYLLWNVEVMWKRKLSRCRRSRKRFSMAQQIVDFETTFWMKRWPFFLNPFLLTERMLLLFQVNADGELPLVGRTKIAGNKGLNSGHPRQLEDGCFFRKECCFQDVEHWQ